MGQFPVFRINWSVTLISFLPVFRINQSVIENIIPLMYPQVDQFPTCFQDQSVCHGRDTVHLMHHDQSVSYLSSGSVCHERDTVHLMHHDQSVSCLSSGSVCHGRDTVHLMHHDQSVSYLSSGSISLSQKRHSTPHAPGSVSFLPVFRINQSVMEETQHTSCTMISQFLTCLQDQTVCCGRHGTPCWVPQMDQVFLPVFRINQSVIEDTVHSTLCAPTGGSVFLPVFRINQSVVEDTVHLMHPKADQLLSLCHAGAGHQKHPTNDAGEVTQVEDVVWLGRCGEELGDWILVHIHGGSHHQLWKGKLTLRPCNT